LDIRWQHIPRLQSTVGPASAFFEDLLADLAQQNIANCKDILRYRNRPTSIPRWL